MVRGTIWENSLRNVHVANVALSNASSGSINMCLARLLQGGTWKPLGGASHVVRRGESDCALQRVPTVALDGVVPLARRIIVVHLDLENAEGAALQGAAHLLRRWRPLVVLESVD